MPHFHHTQAVTHLAQSRHESADNRFPLSEDFWRKCLEDTEQFALQTVLSGKGGPFGAQLWLFNEHSKETILVGSTDSNAVVSKGIASAHAEAENLSSRNKSFIEDFLTERKGNDWQIMQISTGESCPSCRSKQTNFANYLISKHLLRPGQFHVVFKSSYEQTERDAGFLDKSYDQTFRLISQLPHTELKLLFDFINSNSELKAQYDSGKIISGLVDSRKFEYIPKDVKHFLRRNMNKPAAMIICHHPELQKEVLIEQAVGKTAIISALDHLSKKLRNQYNVFASWDTHRADIYTNITDIGPLAYAEILWANANLLIVERHDLSHKQRNCLSNLVNEQAREVSNLTNKELMTQVSLDYNFANAPLHVISAVDDINDQSSAHLAWQDKLSKEKQKGKTSSNYNGIMQ